MLDRRRCMFGWFAGCLDWIGKLIHFQNLDVMRGIASAPCDEGILVLIVDNRASSPSLDPRIDGRRRWVLKLAGS